MPSAARALDEPVRLLLQVPERAGGGRARLVLPVHGEPRPVRRPAPAAGVGDVELSGDVPTMIRADLGVAVGGHRWLWAFGRAEIPCGQWSPPGPRGRDPASPPGGHRLCLRDHRPIPGAEQRAAVGSDNGAAAGSRPREDCSRQASGGARLRDSPADGARSFQEGDGFWHTVCMVVVRHGLYLTTGSASASLPAAAGWHWNPNCAPAASRGPQSIEAEAMVKRPFPQK